MRIKRLFAHFSDDESASNPLVAGFQDDVDSDDQQSPGDTATFTNTHVDLSSDEEEEIGKQSSAIVTSSRDSVLDSDSTTQSLARLPIQWTLGGSTSHDNGDSKLPHEEASSSPNVTSATSVSVVHSDRSDDDSDDASTVAVVTAVQDEVSDDEVTAVVDRSVVDVAPTPHDMTQVNIAKLFVLRSVLASHTLQRYCQVISKNCNVFCYK